MTCLAVCAAIRPKSLHLDERPDLVSDLCLAVELAGFLKRDFGFGIGDGIDDGLLRHDGDLTGLGVDLDLDIFGLPETLLGGHLKGGFDRPDHLGSCRCLFAGQVHR